MAKSPIKTCYCTREGCQHRVRTTKICNSFNAPAQNKSMPLGCCRLADSTTKNKLCAKPRTDEEPVIRKTVGCDLSTVGMRSWVNSNHQAMARTANTNDMDSDRRIDQAMARTAIGEPTKRWQGQRIDLREATLVRWTCRRPAIILIPPPIDQKRQ